MPIKTAESTDWQSATDQQFWFDKFARPKDHLSAEPSLIGLKFSQFQEFLQEALYCYFKKFPILNASKSPEENEAKFTYQQEIQLFKLFDTQNDHLIDREEFAYLCSNWLDKTYRHSSALVVVDVQNDFIDGSLALINGPANQDGVEVVPVINKILDTCKFEAVVYTLDWHPLDHIGFYENLHLRKYRVKASESSSGSATNMSPTSAPLKVNANADNNSPSNEDNTNNSNKTSVSTPNQSLIAKTNGDGNNKFKLKRLTKKVNVFDTVLFDEGRMEQKLWPIHCVQNTWGAQLHPKLRQVSGAIFVEKGTLSHVDAYSAFWDNMRMNETGLRQELISRKISDVFFCGLALDYCVAASAIDSVRAGFTTFVIEDACRGIDPNEIERNKDEMLSSGITLVQSDSVNGYLTDDFQAIDRSLIVDICFRRAAAVS